MPIIRRSSQKFRRNGVNSLPSLKGERTLDGSISFGSSTTPVRRGVLTDVLNLAAGPHALMPALPLHTGLSRYEYRVAKRQSEIVDTRNETSPFSVEKYISQSRFNDWLDAGRFGTLRDGLRSDGIYSTMSKLSWGLIRVGCRVISMLCAYGGVTCPIRQSRYRRKGPTCRGTEASRRPRIGPMFTNILKNWRLDVSSSSLQKKFP